MADPRSFRAVFAFGLPGRALAFCRPFGVVFCTWKNVFWGRVPFCPFSAFYKVREPFAGGSSPIFFEKNAPNSLEKGPAQLH